MSKRNDQKMRQMIRLLCTIERKISFEDRFQHELEHGNHSTLEMHNSIVQSQHRAQVLSEGVAANSTRTIPEFGQFA